MNLTTVVQEKPHIRAIFKEEKKSTRQRDVPTPVCDRLTQNLTQFVRFMLIS